MLLTALVLLAGIGLTRGGTVPLTTKEVALMLRSGYSSETLVREVQKRHFGDELDADAEELLTKAGAKPNLIAALRSETNRASEKELVAAEEKLTAREIEASAHATARQSVAGAEPATPQPASPAGQPNEVYQLLKGNLIHLKQGAVVPFEDSELERKKLFLFFFSANFSAPGRKFTPGLVEYYNRVVQQHPEFEVIFFSADRSQYGMETYFAQSAMPWPAVTFPQIGRMAALMQTDLVTDLPCLLLVNSRGNILSATGGKEPKQPDAVLADVDRYLADPDSRLARRP